MRYAPIWPNAGAAQFSVITRGDAPSDDALRFLGGKVSALAVSTFSSPAPPPPPKPCAPPPPPKPCAPPPPPKPCAPDEDILPTALTCCRLIPGAATNPFVTVSAQSLCGRRTVSMTPSKLMSWSDQDSEVTGPL